MAYTEGHVPDVYQKYGVDSYVEFAVLNVARDFCGKGIAKTLMKLSFELLATQSVNVFKVVTANQAVKHIYRDDFDFELTAEVPIRDFKFEGKRVLDHFQPLDAKFMCFTKKI